MTHHANFDGLPRDEESQVDILEAQAERYGDDTFLIYGPDDRHVSFAELDAVANRTGTALRERGVAPGDTVSLMFRNPLETVFAMYGIQKAGAVYSPINFEYRGQTLSYQLDDLGSDVLLLEDRYVDRLNFVREDLDVHPHVVVMETDAEAASLDAAFSRSAFETLKNGPSEAPDVDVTWDDPVSIIYTSGTTGKPKGCLLSHRWPTYFTKARRAVSSREDTIHSVVPMYHVVGPYWDTTTALMTGGRVALWDRFSTSEFWDRIERYDATNTTLISVMQSWLMNQPEAPDDHRNAINKVQMSPLPGNYDEIAERFGFEFVTCGFGQTESGRPLGGLIHAARGEDATPDDLRRGLDPADIRSNSEDLGVGVVESVPEDRFMGYEMPWADVAILDENDERLPPGEVGHLAVRPQRAEIVLKEYYGAPAKTVDAWRNLWWHTGDAAYRDEEGYFYFVDRMGDVIRRRGENVSSMQIQNAITELDDVAEAAVFPVPAEEGGEDEIATVVQAKDGASLTEADVRSHLEPRLPAFMLPQYVRIDAELPTTETNKLEKYRLKAEYFDD